jgi:hypothetical protein
MTGPDSSDDGFAFPALPPPKKVRGAHPLPPHAQLPGSSGL